MPALCAHPLAAIPFKRYGFSLSALIIGSMMPDGVYFIPFHPISEQFGHTLWGIMGFCLPVGVLVYWVFHALIKYPAFFLLPAFHQTRVWPIVSRQPSWSFAHVCQVLVALCLGTMTHIAWDSCTHWHAWTVQHVPVFQIALAQTAHGTLRLYKVLQHGGTLVGTGILLWWYLTWLQTAPASSVPPQYGSFSRMKRMLRVCLVGGAGFCGLLLGYVNVPQIQDLASFSHFVIYTAKVSITMLVIGFLVFSIWWYVSQRHRGKTQEMVRDVAI